MHAFPGKTDRNHSPARHRHAGQARASTHASAEDLDQQNARPMAELARHPTDANLSPGLPVAQLHQRNTSGGVERSATSHGRAWNENSVAREMNSYSPRRHRE